MSRGKGAGVNGIFAATQQGSMATTKEWIGRVLASQEERVSAYVAFEGAFRMYSQGGSDAAYMSQTKDVTARFQEASTGINAVVSELEAADTPDAKDLCRWIKKLQSLEKDKLHLTVASHVERKRLCQLVEANSSDGKPTCSCCRGFPARTKECEEDPFAEQIQAGRVKDLQSQLDDLVSSINEVLDEIRDWTSESE